MNRPNKNKYINKEFDGSYVIELEKYCDELESTIDKATWCIVNNIDFLKNTKKTETEWKEWFKEKWY